MALSAQIIDKTAFLVTVVFSDNGKSITRNYKRGDPEMLAHVIHLTQMVFLNQEYDRRAQTEYMRNRGAYDAEAEAVKVEVLAQEAA